MKLIQLRYFQAICKYSSMALASRELHISQPALSNSIKELEIEFGSSLFLRSGNRLVLTEEGQTLLTLSTDLLKQSDALVSEMKSMSSTCQEIKFGVPPMISSLIFPQLYHEIRSHYPDISINLREYGSDQCLKHVQDGSLNAALVSHQQHFPTGMDHIDLGSLKIDLYVSTSNPLASLHEFDASMLHMIAEEPMILLNTGTFLNHYITSCFVQQHLEPNIILRTNQLYTISRMVKQNGACSFLFRGLFESDPLITSIPFEESEGIPIHFVWNSELRQPAGVKNLIKLLKNQQLLS